MPKKGASSPRGSPKKGAASPPSSPKSSPKKAAQDDVETKIKAVGDDIRILKEKLKGEGLSGKKINEHADIKSKVAELQALKSELEAGGGAKPAAAASPKASPKKEPTPAPVGDDNEAKIKAIGDEIRVLKEKLKGEGLSGKKINEHADVKAKVAELQALKEAAGAPAAAPAKGSPKNAPSAAPAGEDMEAKVKAVGDEIRVLKEKLKGEGLSGKKINEHPDVKAKVAELNALKESSGAPQAPAKAAQSPKAQPKAQPAKEKAAASPKQKAAAPASQKAAPTAAAGALVSVGNAGIGDVVSTSLNYYIARGGAKLGASGAACSSKASAGPCKRPAAPAAPKPLSNAPVAKLESNARFLKNQKDLGELCKRRFFFRQAFDIYGGVAGFYTYGPPGCALKNNLIKQWRQHFVIEENLLEIEDTCIMQHQVLKASGHVDRFNDFMVKDVNDHSKFYRADKLLEDVMEQKLEEAGITEEQRVEYTQVKNQADAYSKDELAAVFRKYAIKSPDSGNDLTDPYEFNLMYPTPIGPGGYLKGYLRPETAQGIFLNYKFCCEQNSNRLPFGVAQVGKAFRNEIAPRAGLTRQREFTQAEIEYFVNPNSKAHPKFPRVEKLELILFPAAEQLAAKEPVRMTIGDAVRKGIVNNETLGYYISRTHAFLLSAGIEDKHVRFRQHLPTEMAHYATDCWDAEINTCYGWLECVGIADRACFDLNAHGEAANCDMEYKEKLDTPIVREVLAITKACGIVVMKAFKKDGKMVKEWLEALSQSELASIEKQSKAGPVQVEVNGQQFTLEPDHLTFERKTEKQSVNCFTPGVIEPSFGIDRIFYAVLEHVFWCRPKEDDSDDKQSRTVLSLKPSVAPYKVSVLPLDQRISRSDSYQKLLHELRGGLASRGLSYTLDESGATIGKRYSRNDELGIPLALTMDTETLEKGTCTLRDRDSMKQLRLKLSEAPEVIGALCSADRNMTWEQALKRFGAAN